MIDTLAARVAARLLTLREARLSRSLREPAGLDFCSNDYLGLSKDSRIQEHLVAGIRREGCGSTGSRLLRGERESFERVERTFARFKRTERALYFSSGYLANIAVLTTFPEAGDIIFSDERNHASLIDGIRLSHAKRVIFPHNDVNALTRLFEKHQPGGHTFIVTESLFSMEGDQPPLAEYAALCESTGATLIVDEAHAVGLYGAARERLDRGSWNRVQRRDIGQHRRQSAGCQRSVCRRAFLGDRLSDSACETIHLFHRAVAGHRQRNRGQSDNRRSRTLAS